MCLFFIYYKYCPDDEQAMVSILKKSPDVDDVKDLIKNHSAKWNDFAMALKVDEDTRSN